jgi:hypothetical protein
MPKLNTFLASCFSVAFVACAQPCIADEQASSGGFSGGYIGASYLSGSIDDLKTKLDSGATDSSFDHSSGNGGRLQFGYDFGPVRLDGRIMGLHADVDSIDGSATKPGSESAIGITTINLAWDINRFELNKEFGFTPFVGAGAGVSGGWTNGKKQSDALNFGILDRDKFDLGTALSGEVGILLDYNQRIGIELGYNLINTDIGGTSMLHHIGSAGLRLSL